MLSVQKSFALSLALLCVFASIARSENARTDDTKTGQLISDEIGLMAYCFQTPNAEGWTQVQQFKMFTLFVKNVPARVHYSFRYDDPIHYRILIAYSSCYYEFPSYWYRHMGSKELSVRAQYAPKRTDHVQRLRLKGFSNLEDSNTTKDIRAPLSVQSVPKKPKFAFGWYTVREQQDRIIKRHLRHCNDAQRVWTIPSRRNKYPWTMYRSITKDTQTCVKQVDSLMRDTFADISILTQDGTDFDDEVRLGFFLGEPYLNGRKIEP